MNVDVTQPQIELDRYGRGDAPERIRFTIVRFHFHRTEVHRRGFHVHCLDDPFIRSTAQFRL